MSSKNPIALFQTRALYKEFNEHCIDSCVDFASVGKVSAQEDTCLRNCAAKVGHYKKFAKDSGFPIK